MQQISTVIHDRLENEPLAEKMSLQPAFENFTVISDFYVELREEFTFFAYFEYLKNQLQTPFLSQWFIYGVLAETRVPPLPVLHSIQS